VSSYEDLSPARQRRGPTGSPLANARCAFLVPEAHRGAHSLAARFARRVCAWHRWRASVGTCPRPPYSVTKRRAASRGRPSRLVGCPIRLRS
jgi:hypothetical protein